MAFEKKIALAGSARESVAGASIARAIDNNEVVNATVVLRRRTPTAVDRGGQRIGLSAQSRTAAYGGANEDQA